MKQTGPLGQAQREKYRFAEDEGGKIASGCIFNLRQILMRARIASVGDTTVTTLTGKETIPLLRTIHFCECI